MSSWPSDPAKRPECLSWLFWQMGSTPYLGGGFGHFYAYAEDKQQYPIDRFTMETKRQLDVLDRRLADNRFVCGDDYTIADMAIWPWYGGLVIFDQYGRRNFSKLHPTQMCCGGRKEIHAREPVKRGAHGQPHSRRTARTAPRAP